MMYIVTNAAGEAVSIGSRVASPLPAGLSIVEVSDAEGAAIVAGRRMWDAATRLVVDTPATPVVASPEEKLAQARTVLDQISQLPAPVFTADVVDLLDDLRTVL